jgi:WD40 repeat protein
VIVLPVPKNAARSRIDGVAFGPDGQSLAAAGSGVGLQLWDDVFLGGPPRILKNPEAPYLDGPVEFRSDGRFVMCGSAHGPVVWPTDGSRSVIVPPFAYGSLCRASFAPDDSILVADYRQGTPPNIGVIELRPLSSPIVDRAVWTHPTPDQVGHTPIVSADGTTVVTYHAAVIDAHYHRRPAVVTHDLRTGGVLRTSGPGPAQVGRITVALSHGFLVQFRDRQLSVWKIDGANDWQQPVATMKNDQNRNFTGIAFHPSGRYLAATSNDATVKLYDTTTWEVARTFTWDIGKMRSIAFSPDGTLAAAGSDSGKVVVWDVDF